jgi:hypothetical protein
VMKWDVDSSRMLLSVRPYYIMDLGHHNVIPLISCAETNLPLP